MSVHLLSKHHPLEFHVEWRAWYTLLQAARRHGWQPAGTTHPDDPGWSGLYHSNDGQWVSTADALNLAHALQRAIALENQAPVARHVDVVGFICFAAAGAFQIY